MNQQELLTAIKERISELETFVAGLEELLDRPENDTADRFYQGQDEMEEFVYWVRPNGLVWFTQTVYPEDVWDLSYQSENTLLEKGWPRVSVALDLLGRPKNDPRKEF